MQGPDAYALNTALRTLGYAAPDSDYITWDTITAYNALAATQGTQALTAQNGWIIDTSLFIWFPAPSVTIASCMTSIGSTIAPGQELFTTTATPSAASLPASKQDVVPGDRIITIGGAEFPITAETTTITDSNILSAIMSSNEFRLASLSNGGSGNVGGSNGSTLNVSYTWRLSQPIEAFTVPPSALYGITDASACVSANGASVPVTIIASQLGKTIVSTQDGSMLKSVEVPAPDDQTCVATS